MDYLQRRKNCMIFLNDLLKENHDVKNFRISQRYNLVKSYLDNNSIIINEHYCIDILPKSICYLEGLQELKINNTRLHNLPENIGRLKSLKMLDISNNHLQWLPDSITELENLEELSVKNNLIHYLPKNIGNLKLLKKLNLYMTNLQEIPDSFFTLENLKYVNMPTDTNIWSLPESVKESKIYPLIKKQSIINYGNNHVALEKFFEDKENAERLIKKINNTSNYQTFKYFLLNYHILFQSVLNPNILETSKWQELIEEFKIELPEIYLRIQHSFNRKIGTNANTSFDLLL
jgi:Leucine-rich repeat (LRR) protein